MNAELRSEKPFFISADQTLGSVPMINNFRIALVNGEFWYHDVNMGPAFPHSQIKEILRSENRTFGIAVERNMRGLFDEPDDRGIGIWVHRSVMEGK